MPVFVTPNSNSEDHAPVRESNPCHEPHSGRFAPKGVGVCTTGGATEPVNVRKLRAVVEQDPQFNVDDALDAGGPGLRAQYAKLQAQIPEAQTSIMSRMTRVIGDIRAQQVPYEHLWEGEGPRVTVAPPKGARRTLEKAALDYDGDLTQVKDAVRAAIAVDSPAQVPQVLDAVRKHFDVVREKDRFSTPLVGYRDYLFNVRLKGGLVGEVQVHVKPMLKAKETVGHKLYQEMRRYASMSGDAAQSALAQLQQQTVNLYSGAWSLALLAAASHGVKHP